MHTDHSISQDTASPSPDVFSLLRSGQWMDGFSEEIGPALARCEELCFRLNSTPPSDKEKRDALAREIFGHIGAGHTIHSPFACDLGFNISIGDRFVGNFHLTILDEAKVSIGDNVFIGPNTTICTVIHAFDPQRRNAGIMRAEPVTIHDNVWIAANVVVLPGVSIGEGAVVGAGSVVKNDVAPGTLVAGNPARFIRYVNDCSE